ncbi:MAG: DUF5666 domain-containing protein [Burkholderiaceae bacterium]
MMKTTMLTALRQSNLRSRMWMNHLSLSLLAGFAALWGAAGLSLLVAAALVACGGGGGGGVASIGSGGTGSFSAFNVGTITGFGSVFVNGVRFDDSSPSLSVSDEDGKRDRSDLRLGMVVRVQGSVDANGSATASSFAFDSELLGPVRSINTAAKTLNILGQNVTVGLNTVFDGSLPSGFDSLAVGQVLEVHGYLNPSTNTLQATLIELKSRPDRYKLSGTVNRLQNAPTNTFQIGSETISFNGLSTADIAPGLANGVLVRVRLAIAPNANGSLQAARLRGNQDTPNDRDRTEVEGLISAFASPPSTLQFSIGAVRVDASTASFPNGTAGLAIGTRVEVKGALKAGTLVASEVQIELAESGKEIQLKGAIGSLNPVAKTFELRGVTVSYTNATRFDNGAESKLADGAVVEMRGQTAPNSSTVNANRIKFD